MSRLGICRSRGCGKDHADSVRNSASIGPSGPDVRSVIQVGAMTQRGRCCMTEQESFDSGGPKSWPFEPFPDTALEGSVVDRFSEIARRHSDRVAVSDVKQTFTFAEFAALVDAIAAAIGVADLPFGPVAILLRSEAR